MIEYIHSRLYLVLVKVMVERQPFPAPEAVIFGIILTFFIFDVETVDL